MTSTSSTDRVEQTARAARDSRALHWTGRAGLVSRGLIFLLLGALTFAVALGGGGSGQDTDKKGALVEVSQHPGGAVLLVLLAVGFAAYALWRFSEVAFGITGEQDGLGRRLQSAGRGVLYCFLCYSAISVLVRSGGSSSDSNKALTARVMSHTGGRWLIGAVGLVVVGGGIVIVVRACQRKFAECLERQEMSQRTWRVVMGFGIVGSVARGLVLLLAGALVVQAAVTFDPDKAGGLDTALKTLAGQPFGPYLLGLAAIGLACFGVYGLAEARWRRT